MGGAALPVGHDTACGLDHRNRGLYVISVQPGLDNQIDLTGGQQGISIAVHPVPCQLHLVRNGLKSARFCFGSNLGESGEQDRLIKATGRARFKEWPRPRGPS